MRPRNDLSRVKKGDVLWIRRTANKRLGGDDCEVTVVKAGPKQLVVDWNGVNASFRREDGVATGTHGYEMVAHKAYFDALDELDVLIEELRDLGLEFRFGGWQRAYSNETLRQVVALLHAEEAD